MAQALPQAPQLAASVSVSTQFITPAAVVQTVRGAAQVSAQRPAEHICPDGHAVPHEPQLAGSLSRVAQTSPQRLWPDAQLRRQRPT